MLSMQEEPSCWGGSLQREEMEVTLTLRVKEPSCLGKVLGREGQGGEGGKVVLSLGCVESVLALALRAAGSRCRFPSRGMLHFVLWFVLSAERRRAWKGGRGRPRGWLSGGGGRR